MKGSRWFRSGMWRSRRGAILPRIGAALRRRSQGCGRCGRRWRSLPWLFCFSSARLSTFRSPARRRNSTRASSPSSIMSPRPASRTGCSRFRSWRSSPRCRGASGPRRAALRAAWGLVASYALYFLAVQAVSGIVSQVVKHLVGRARPRLIEIAGPFHFDLFSLKAVLASFPSGHTTTVFAACGALSLLSPRLGPWVAAAGGPRRRVAGHRRRALSERRLRRAVPRARLGAAGGAGSGAAQDRLHPRARRAAAHAAREGPDRPDLAEGSGLSAHPLKALVEIRLEVLDVFEAD